MKFASVAVIAAIAVSASALSPKKQHYEDKRGDMVSANPHQITCAQKAGIINPRFADKVCCQNSHLCGDLHKCTPSYCNSKPVEPKPETPEHDNEYEITCGEKRERNPKALHGRIHKNRSCCQWSGKCGELKKCTQSYCQKDAKPSEAFGDRFDFQF